MFGKMNVSLQALRRSLFWAVVAAVALVAQFGLAIHQLEHRFHPDVAAVAEDCIACQFSSTMAEGPSSNAAPIPLDVELGSIVPVGQFLPRQEDSPSNFHSRAPPSSVSV